MSLLLFVLVPTRLAIWWSRLTQRDRPLPSGRGSFIIFRLDALGDLVLTTPLFRELRRNYPDTKITVVVQQAYRSSLDSNPYIDELLSLPSVRGPRVLKPAALLLSALLFYWRELRERRFDVAISPRWDTDENLATLLCTLTTAGTRVGYSEHASVGKRHFNRGFDKAFDVCVDPGPLRHEVERNLAVVEALGGTVVETQTEIQLMPSDREYADNELRAVPADSILVALGIGAQSPGRRWPLDRYSAVIRELSKQNAVHAVITCAPSEHKQAQQLAHALPISCTISDSADIRETCALLERCDLFIGNDTGAAHLAAAMHCPTIVISRHPKSGDAAHPNSPQRFAPWGNPGLVLQPERGIEGCTTRCVQPGPHCIEQISVGDVMLAAQTILMQSSPVRDKLKASPVL